MAIAAMVAVGGGDHDGDVGDLEYESAQLYLVLFLGTLFLIWVALEKLESVSAALQISFNSGKTN